MEIREYAKDWRTNLNLDEKDPPPVHGILEQPSQF
jgi:hypothetical protein